VQDAVILAPVLTAYPADAEVGTIQLPEESGPDDGVVFLLHRLSQGGEIRFVRRIILVLQDSAMTPGEAAVRKASAICTPVKPSARLARPRAECRIGAVADRQAWASFRCAW